MKKKLRLQKETLQRMNMNRVVGGETFLDCVTMITICTCGFSCGNTCLGTCEDCVTNNCSGNTCGMTCGGATCGGICDEWL